jgi:hypothetical protein
METVRDKVKDTVCLHLQEVTGLDRQEVYEEACDLTDSIMEALGFTEEMQDCKADIVDRLMSLIGELTRGIDYGFLFETYQQIGISHKEAASFGMAHC